MGAITSVTVRVHSLPAPCSGTICSGTSGCQPRGRQATRLRDYRPDGSRNRRTTHHLAPRSTSRPAWLAARSPAWFQAWFQILPPALSRSLILALPLFLALALTLACWPGGIARAHDYWIEPSNFRPEVGERVRLTHKVGEDFVGTTQPYIPAWFSDYRVVQPTGASATVRGVVGDDPAGSFQPMEPGLYVIGYRSERSFVTLDAALFRKYLAQEGLEFIEQQRELLGERDVPAREYYSRCVKSMVLVGGFPDEGSGVEAGYDQPLGYTLELIPDRNPYTLRPGEMLPLRLLHEGRPLAGALVIASTQAQPQDKVAVRTDAQGRVALPLARPGVWLVKAVHMVPALKDSKARWESFWAALTFQLPELSELPEY